MMHVPLGHTAVMPQGLITHQVHGTAEWRFRGFGAYVSRSAGLCVAVDESIQVKILLATCFFFFCMVK